MREKLLRIKRSRLKPEELFLIDIIENMTINEDDDDHTIWVKDGLITLQLNKKNVLFNQPQIYNSVWVNTEIWRVFGKDYGNDYKQTKLIIKTILDKYLNLDDCFPYIVQ